MNYVGQLAETVFGTVKELYRGLNPATLSGGIDVLVVRQPDGSFRCSPFHVRFGKLGVLRSREKVVDIEINGEPVDLHMKLGDSGEAFFVQELDSDEEEVPPRLCTSPIPWGGLSGFPSDSQLGTASEPEGLVITGRRKRRRRRKPRRREDAVDSSSEELEAGAESELPSQEKPTAESPSAQEEEESSPQPKDIYPYSDGECTPQASLSSGDLMSPKSDSELELRSLEPSPLRAESHMQWAWGRLPKVAKAERHELSMVLDSMVEAISALPGEPDPSPSSSAAGVDMSRLPTLQPVAREDTALPGVETRCEETLVGSPLAARETKETKTQNSRGAGHPPATKSWSWATLESHIPSGHPDVSKGKGSLKRNHHLGPSDIYLDDLSSLDSEDAALYFPQSDCGMGPRRWSEPSNQKLLENPNPEHVGEPTLDSVDKVALSLCGGLAETRDIPLEKFNQHVVSYEDLTKNPGLLDDPNLVVKINEKHYNWAVAAPMILCLQAFQKNLPKSTVDKLEKEKMPRKGGRWWFSWRRRDFPAEEHSAQREKTAAREQQGHREKTEVLSSDDDAPDSPVILEVPRLPPPTPGCVPTYKKSLRLSSEQIRYLNLHEGANDVVFSVTTQYQGTCRCKATIYLWNWDDKVVISDIDGTITKSDALGHILPQLGKDWTHQGITSLYHKIHLNGYKFLYCSARAIGMADLTKGYLQWVSEHGCGLPKGPILLSPSSLFSALHREVIEKKPEVFKVACLSDIQQLFLPQGQPFYAAFGNRPNDVFAYRQVGLPESRIFTVNPRGDLVQELIKNHKSTYQRLGEVVELLFPPVVRGPSTDLANPEYSNFCYWREPLPHVDFDALA
ncbi:phosphatidate phosphatase LPIN3 isoform X1 [Microtus oregoni]|uniref:phosphatidate phosphatase LPIN3 isoform X1 n=1 Tax=Microtus oregoni TaxID=111838 RepID=UPI001BB1677F|nr:phosphatidate phosphatase LPIN3 isoform X1 [Microtus oregoni]XP_041526647.1 phosphatidate phosphatase LPIN3 isoform X1 [Microtus oregoni]XP_041526648.1 phosphatidate phosphatase LPIN3 isoform X1 [Microtus oregoni]XP_041526649.1 phosphatidate phosphatase LPIN3 isoform X1 [Microtus oregoni]XP_041526650.1 phosphatidate phosphatase LPIN3 isoform X1 [Microtus oregoni]XP_041526651.1 phosphatidate phosphatase LPIN3 isoform X1 [Microtus oregoni]XP_041526653.1 phosphatidate phosphatase LPIN3 isofor